MRLTLRENCAMVSKCANPACPKRFLYLHQGKLFNLTPTPELEAAGVGFVPGLYERFWLCDDCCQRMTLIWTGIETKLVPLRGACTGVEQTLPAQARRTSLMKRK